MASIAHNQKLLMSVKFILFGELKTISSTFWTKYLVGTVHDKNGKFGLYQGN